MTTIKIHGCTLSAHALANMAECFGAGEPPRKGDFAATNAGRMRRKARRQARHAKACWNWN